jgi:hypothetical protein
MFLCGGEGNAREERDCNREQACPLEILDLDSLDSSLAEDNPGKVLEMLGMSIPIPFYINLILIYKQTV